MKDPPPCWVVVLVLLAWAAVNVAAMISNRNSAACDDAAVSFHYTARPCARKLTVTTQAPIASK